MLVIKLSSRFTALSMSQVRMAKCTSYPGGGGGGGRFGGGEVTS